MYLHCFANGPSGEGHLPNRHAEEDMITEENENLL